MSQVQILPGSPRRPKDPDSYQSVSGSARARNVRADRLLFDGLLFTGRAALGGNCIKFFAVQLGSAKHIFLSQFNAGAACDNLNV